MHILVILFVGLIVGVIAELLMPGRDSGGFTAAVLPRVAEALAARWIGRLTALFSDG